METLDVAGTAFALGAMVGGCAMASVAITIWLLWTARWR